MQVLHCLALQGVRRSVGVCILSKTPKAQPVQCSAHRAKPMVSRGVNKPILSNL